MSSKVTLPKLNGSSLRIGIVRAQWHQDMTGALSDQVTHALLECGVKEKNIVSIDVPGSYEVVYGAADLIKKAKVDVVVAIGILLKGETMHFEYIADAVSHGLMHLNTDTGVPVIFGILTCLNGKQAHDRSLGDKSHGYNWGLSAVQMGLIKKTKKRK